MLRRIFIILYCLLILLGLSSCNKAEVESSASESISFSFLDFSDLFVNETGYYLLFTMDGDTTDPSSLQTLVVYKSTDHGHTWENTLKVDSLRINPYSSCISSGGKIYFYGEKGEPKAKISICSYDYKSNAFTSSLPYFDCYGGFVRSTDDLLCYDSDSLYFLDDQLNALLMIKMDSDYSPFSIAGETLMYTNFEDKFTDLSTDSLIKSPVIISAIQRVGDSLLIIGKGAANENLQRVVYDLTGRSFSKISWMNEYSIVHRIETDGDSLYFTFFKTKEGESADIYYTKNNGKDWKIIHDVNVDFLHDPYCLYKDTLFVINEQTFTSPSAMSKIVLE